MQLLIGILYYDVSKADHEFLLPDIYLNLLQESKNQESSMSIIGPRLITLCTSFLKKYIC